MMQAGPPGEAKSGKTGVSCPCFLHVKRHNISSGGGSFGVTNVETDTAGVKRALERILAWPEVARSPQLANFLSYIVDRRLGGDAQSIKAYSIAVDVFGRPPDFDPQADPIVRVQARRLRSLLDQYYRGPGADDPVRIQLPIGRYVPDFIDGATEPPAQSIGAEPRVVAQTPPRARPRGHITISWFVLLVLALGAAALTYSLATLGPRQQQAVAETGALQRPRLRVMEFQNLTGDSTLTSYISALAIELVTDFAPFLLVDVSLGGRDEVVAAESDPTDYVLTGIVRVDPVSAGDYQFSAILTDQLTNAIVWNWTVTLPKAQMTERGGVEFVSQELLSILGGTRGPLHARARALLEASNIAGQENPYLCAVLFSLYRQSSTMGAARRFNDCTSALPDRERLEGNIVAARASLVAETGIGAPGTAPTQIDRLRAANDMMTDALRGAPTSSFVWEQRARIHEVQAMHDEAEAAYGTALQLNPANMDAVAAHARHLALMGRIEDAMPAAQRAIEATQPTAQPDWYFCVPALAAIDDGRFDQAEDLAGDCARGDVELGSVLGLLAAQGRGDAAEIDQQLARVLEVPSFRDAGIITQLRRRVADTALLGAIRTSLEAAGVPVQSLMAPY
jgi:tetratricopeptide (TPR) repeat protein